jgi:hypothetical protein
LVYNAFDGNTSSVIEGVQQPFEISVLTGIPRTDIQLELSTYPNPVIDHLYLSVDNFQDEILKYQLYNIQGTLIQSAQLVDNITSIKMEDMPESTYILKVTTNNKPIKTFKIVKF